MIDSAMLYLATVFHGMEYLIHKPVCSNTVEEFWYMLMAFIKTSHQNHTEFNCCCILKFSEKGYWKFVTGSGFLERQEATCHKGLKNRRSKTE